MARVLNAPRSFSVWECRRKLQSSVRHSKRLYHSYEYAASTPFSPTESAILSSALKQVPNHGFTAESLILGAQDAGYLSISANLFPRGAFSLVNYYLFTQRLALSDHFQRPDISPSRHDSHQTVKERIRSVTLHRLLSNAPYINHYQSALALLSLPSNLQLGLKELARLADEILYLAGSTTVTTGWYTDRAALATIYASAELFMTQDKSKEFHDTADFLGRRIDEADTLRGAIHTTSKWVGMQAGGLIDGLRSKGVRI